MDGHHAIFAYACENLICTAPRRSTVSALVIIIIIIIINNNNKQSAAAAIRLTEKYDEA